MSWGIKLFAEKRRKGSDKWEMIGKTNIMSEVKDFLLTDTMDYDAGIQDIEENTFDPVDNSELSQGVLDFYDGNIDEYHWVKVYPLDSMRRLCDRIIEQYDNTVMMCYKALGFKCEINPYIDYSLDIHSDRYREGSADPVPNYNPLTYPINKELLEELNNRSAGYKKALRWNGLLCAIEDMAEEDYDLDRDAEIRLVFVRSC